MTLSNTITQATTFTVTHAKHIAAKVATDLKRVQRFYGKPSDVDIDAYAYEATVLLAHGCLESVTYGFQRNGRWVEPTLSYQANDLTGATNNDPGKVPPGADISNAGFSSFLTYSPAWSNLSARRREEMYAQGLIRRAPAGRPGVDGYWKRDLTYSAGGRSLDRFTLRRRG